MTLDEAYRRLRAELIGAPARTVSKETKIAETELVEKMVQFYLQSAVDVGGGHDPKLFTQVVGESKTRAMALITMFVTVLKELPEGGVLAPEIWERVTEIVDGIDG